MSRTNRYMSGLACNLLNQGLVLLLGLWLMRFLLNQLGRDEYGRWLIIGQVLTLLELTDFGVAAVLPREVAYRTGVAGGDANARTALLNKLLSGARRITLYQLPLVAGGAAVLWLLLVGGRLDDPGNLPLATIILCFAALFPLRIYNATLQGLQDFLFVGMTNTAGWVAQSAVMVLLIVAGFGFWGLVGGWVVGRCLTSLVCRHRLRTAFQGVLPSNPLGRRTDDVGRLLASGLWVSVANLAVALHYNVDVVILGYVLGPAPIVVYTCTMKVVTVCTWQIVGLVTVAGPALSELRECGSAEQMVRASTALGQLILLASGLAACIILMANEGFVSWWVGPGQYGGSLLTCLFLAGMLLQHLSFVLSQVLFCLGYERAIAVVVLASGAVVASAILLLAPWCGLTAAPAGSLLGVGLVNLPAFVFLLAREPRLSLSALLRGYLPWAVRFLVLAGGLGWLRSVWTPKGLLEMVLTAGGVVAVYCAVMLPALLNMALWGYLRPRLGALCNRIKARPMHAG